MLQPSQRVAWWPAMSFPVLTLCAAIPLAQKNNHLGVAHLQTKRQSSQFEVPTHKPSICFEFTLFSKCCSLSHVPLKWIECTTGIDTNTSPLWSNTP